MFVTPDLLMSYAFTQQVSSYLLLNTIVFLLRYYKCDLTNTYVKIQVMLLMPYM